MAKPSSTRPFDRHADTRVRTAMEDTRIVALVGPRQSGKTTLARQIASDRGLTYVTLDDDQSRQFAVDDPDGLVRDLDRAVIDEIQRSPRLILALKKSVDEDRRPGRFLITGSVDLFRSSLSPDSLAGRVETVQLLPLSQAEIERRPPSRFLERAFSADFPKLKATGRTTDLAARVLAGGFPEALARPDSLRRGAWLNAYAESLATRDAADLADVSKTAELSRLLGLAAAGAGQTVNLAAMARTLGVDGKTVDRWLTLLEQMFVIRRVCAWHRNDLKRLVKTPKLHFLDTGLLAALSRTDARLLAGDRQRLGTLLEGFVYSELAKLAAQQDERLFVCHFRDHDKDEVDLVLERPGAIVGIEVKATASVKPDDFRGLKTLQAATGKAFIAGIVLHDGDRIQQFGDGLFAMPFDQLWSD